MLTRLEAVHRLARVVSGCYRYGAVTIGGLGSIKNEDDQIN
jgi:hypothetical protein